MKSRVTTHNSTILKVFDCCVRAIASGKLIRRETRQDKEFHFQNWFRARLEESGFHHEIGGRNSYPDFRMVNFPEGYEVKGLAYPGRELNYDCNSQVPSGHHNGRTIFYVFGRYPASNTTHWRRRQRLTPLPEKNTFFAPGGWLADQRRRLRCAK